MAATGAKVPQALLDLTLSLDEVLGMPRDGPQREGKPPGSDWPARSSGALRFSPRRGTLAGW